MLAAAALAALADALPDTVGASRQWQHHSIQRRGVQPPVENPRLNAQTVQGCFKSAGNLTMIYDNDIYNSMGKCSLNICYAQKYAVGGTMGGSQCYCGDAYPPKEDLVDNSNCNYDCTGIDTEACGGINFWTIYNTGVKLIVPYAEPSSSSATSSSTTSTPTATGTAAEVTVTATQSSTSDSGNNSGGKSNVAGIAAGAVVGVLVVAGALGGGFLYMRRKRNKEIEEEHRRNAAANDFFGKPPRSSGGTSMTDARLDPVLVNRRLSDGSIADNQDYSRRILRVGPPWAFASTISH
ncbi:hypothetical protein N657DRAFT_576498 [Parathielavia appendiculata]|uniref:WSC domain-containing protein n=1 Tax=Parathielavia appendiculata TaxID=2587402 RepID=A0AAN6Z1L6_9PEZI|nr:hypothetical protein N657DRAFT_576498 [Parathielavia appendiculata]